MYSHIITEPEKYHILMFTTRILQMQTFTKGSCEQTMIMIEQVTG